MADTYTYSDLADQYGNFHVPSAKVMIDGENVMIMDKGAIESLSVSLSLAQASSATFQVIGAYDRKSRAWDSGVKGKFVPGKIVEIELGYLSSTTSVLKGFIASVVMNFNENPVLSITVMDVRRLMMQASKKKCFQDPNYSDMAASILSAYSALCTPEVDATNNQLTKKIWQTSSDYHFILNELAKKTNREFFVLADKAYFREPKKTAAAMMTLEYGLNLFSFTREAHYIDCKVLVNIYDKEQQRAVFAEETVTGADDQVNVLSESPVEICIQEDMSTEAEAAVKAKQLSAEKGDRARAGSGSCIGLPEIVPGRFIKLDKLDTSANHKYYIVQVNHQFGGSGFQTSFQVEGWED